MEMCEMFIAGDKKMPLARPYAVPYTVVAKPRIDRFLFGVTRPIACFVHVALAPRRAAQEADPRFSRPAALELVNQKVASHLGIEAGAPKVKSQTLSQRTPTEEERRSESSVSS